MGTSGENKESHIPKKPEKEDNVIIDPNTLEMNKLKNENKKLKDDISTLSKQIEQFKLDIQPEKPINSIKNNINTFCQTPNILQNNNNFTINNLNNNSFIIFKHMTGASTSIMVNDSTTVGEVITQLYNKMNIPKEKKLSLLYNANCLNYGCNEQIKFKNLLTKQNPNEVILIVEKN